MQAGASKTALLALAFALLGLLPGTGSDVLGVRADAPGPGVVTSPKLRGPISFPVRRRGPTSSGSALDKRKADEMTVEEMAAVLQRDRARHARLFGAGEAEESPRAEKRASWESIPLTSYYGDVFYYAAVRVGTPAQTVDILLDTGSSDFWVQSTTCPSCNATLVQPYLDGSKSLFDPTASTSFQQSAVLQTVSITYADNSGIRGYLGRDEIGIGSYTVPNQTFIVATEAKGGFRVAGIMGLAWPSLSHAKANPWWYNALSQFSEPEMSFYLTEWNNPGKDLTAPGGQFTLGGRNSSLYDGEVTFVPILANPKWWAIPVQKMTVATNTTKTLDFSSANQSGVIDTGTTLIYAPNNIVTAFFQIIPGAVAGELLDPQLAGFWALPCNATVNTQIQFSSTVSVILPSTNLMWQYANSLRLGYCVASLVASDAITSNAKMVFPLPSEEDSHADPTAAAPSSSPSWIIGDAFIKSTYVTFRRGNGTSSDPPSVGFAPLKGVNYQGTGDLIIGVDGNGVNGAIGNAGDPVVSGGGNPTSTSPATSAGSHLGSENSSSASSGRPTGTASTTSSNTATRPLGNVEWTLWAGVVVTFAAAWA